ncbi:MAG TPA: hypothetical protein VGE44_14485 [Daejeonella sp.]|uniref:hypothetical protein n=1 Tax=Daejeonella sp. TaxID=2805397 RepID=UPI002ED9DF45
MTTDRELLLEALREIKDLKEQVEEVLLLFKPVPVIKRLTKKQKFELEVQKHMAKTRARILATPDKQGKL